LPANAQIVNRRNQDYFSIKIFAQQLNKTSLPELFSSFFNPFLHISQNF